MRLFPSQHQRLFLRTEMWRNGRPTSVVGWLVFSAVLTGAGLVTAVRYDLLGGVLLGVMGIVVFSANWVFALVFGELRLQRAVHTRVYGFLNAVTHATYPYDRITFPMQVYLVWVGADGKVHVCTDDPWWGGPTFPSAAGSQGEPTYLVAPWIAQTVDAMTLVEGLRVMPSLTRFTTFADREHPTPTMHQLFALRAAVLEHTPPGVTPVWT